MLELNLHIEVNTVDIFVYDKNENFLPNNQHLLGSASFELKTYNAHEDVNDDYSLFSQDMEITRAKWKSLDKKSERCSDGHKTQDTETCITR